MLSNSDHPTAGSFVPRRANRVIRCAAATYYSISGNSTHIHGTRLPVEEPSTASQADIPISSYWSQGASGAKRLAMKSMNARAFAAG